MGYSKKTAKGRLDKYYHLAKEQGFRARSAFKLVQLNKKYEFLQQARVVIDLCAAPGGWCQVAAKYMPKSKIIIGVDLVPIKPISGVITMVNDITTDKCRSDLKRELKDWKADVVLHDGAPNVGNSWVQDAYTQSELVLSSLKLATEFLIEGGWFVTKVFRSKDYNSLMWVFNQLFKKVEATKPSSSRDVSAEIFVVCKGFLAPKSIDPRFLDPKSVFTDVDSLINGGGNAAGKMNLLHPEKKKRHRDGYEDGANILFKKVDVMEYLTSTAFTIVLSEANCFDFDAANESTKVILAHPETTSEIKSCCEDLKVLGRREYKLLLKWRLQMRKALGIAEDEKKPSKAAEANEDNEEEDVEQANDSLRKKIKREKRKKLEKKAKQRLRLNLQMENANDLANDLAEEGLFALSKIKSTPRINIEDIRFSESESESEEPQPNEMKKSVQSEDEDDDGRYARLDAELEACFETSNTESASTTSKRKQKKRKSVDSDASGSDLEAEETSSELNDLKTKNLLVSLDNPTEPKLRNSTKASLWFSNPLFQSMNEISNEIQKHQMEKKTKSSNRKYQENPMESLRAEAGLEPGNQGKPTNSKSSASGSTGKGSKQSEENTGSIVFVAAQDPYAELFDLDEAKEVMKTEEGMTLATRLASTDNRKRLQEELVDESFNRFAFSEKSSELPTWFVDDESKHNKPIKPITREVADAIKAQLKEINGMPIKKVLEAKGRNKIRATRRLDGLKKKAEAIMGSGEGGEKSKLIQISKLLRKPTAKREKPTLVVARGVSRGLKGRPKGVKGRYKMVDRRMMKELRAQKNLKAKQLKKRN